MDAKDLRDKFFKLDIRTIIIVGLIILLLIRSCGNTTGGDKPETIKIDGKKYEVVDHKIDTVFIDKIIKVPQYVPKYITKVETITVPVNVDTLAILKDYFAVYSVNDTINLTYEFNDRVKDSLGNKPNPTLGYGIITDRITQNKIDSRDITWNFSIPTIYDTKIVKEPAKNQLYYGFNMGVNKQDIFSSIGGGLIFKNKKDNMYQLNLGVTNATNGVSPYMGLGMYWKIKLKK
jgi:hypothetical protein